MADALHEVLAFFKEWEADAAAVTVAMQRRFTAATVWENVGVSKTTGFDEAKAFMDGFTAQFPFERAEVIVHHAAATGNIVLTERTDIFYDGSGNAVVTIKLMGIFEMDGPRIIAWRDYFDTAKGF